MNWVLLGVAASVATLVLLTLGYPLARIVGIRGFAAVGVAPAFAMTVICGASVVLPWAGVAWSPLPVLVFAAVIAAILGVGAWLTRHLRPSASEGSRFDGALLIALVLVSGLIAWRTVSVIQDPDAISQTFDNVFHLNALRWILDTGSASALEIGYMTNPEGPPTFYPSGWHAFVTLVIQITGAPLTIALNGSVLAISAVVWPLGAILLSRTLFGRSAAVSFGTGVLAASLPSFPLLPMDYGVLYPFQLGLALLPAVLAVTARFLGLTAVRDDVGTLWWGIALLGCLPGLALVHPGALMAWLALSAPLAAVRGVVAWRERSSMRSRIKVVAVAALYLGAAAAMVYVLRPPASARSWQPEMSYGEALIALASTSPWYASAAVLGSVSILAGAAWALISRTSVAIAALGIYLTAGFLFVVVAAAPFPFRDVFTAPWYNNIPRIAAILAIAVVPLGTFGIQNTWSMVAARAHRAGWSGPIVRNVGMAGVGVLVVISQVGPTSAMPDAERVASASFALTPDSPLLDSDEAALVSRLPEVVEEGYAIAGSPWTGASVAYALTGATVLMPHIQMEISENLDSVNQGLADAEPGSEVCEAISALGVGYVLDFGTREVHGASHVFPGLEDLDESSAVELIDAEGSARLYQVTGCTE